MAAQLTLRLQVFIASPNDVKDERDEIENGIRGVAASAAEDNLLLVPYRWETGARPTYNRPQQFINEELARSELVVGILGSRLGTGFQEELRIAREQVDRGQSADVLLYVRKASPEAAAQLVQEFRKGLEASQDIFICDYETPDQLGALFRGHLGHWLRQWRQLPAICQRALRHSPPEQARPDDIGENLLQAIRRQPFDPFAERALSAYLGAEAVRLYQSGNALPTQPMPVGPLKAAAASWPGQALNEEPFNPAFLSMALLIGWASPSPSPLRTSGSDQVVFADPAWYYFYCAHGLVEAIKQDRVQAVKNIPYNNRVHQYLRALGKPEAQALVPRLRAWLLQENGLTAGLPVARNFAAYVLGMLGAAEAANALAHAAEHDRGLQVREYSLMSLAKLRSRRHVSKVLQLYEWATEDDLRKLLERVLCHIVGVAHYEF